MNRQLDHKHSISILSKFVTYIGIIHINVRYGNDSQTNLWLYYCCYREKFESIHSFSSRRTKASIKWDDDWILLLDGLLQANAFARDHDGVSLPTNIRKLIINVKDHKDTKVDVFDDITCMNAGIYSIYNYTE